MSSDVEREETAVETSDPGGVAVATETLTAERFSGIKKLMRDPQYGTIIPLYCVIAVMILGSRFINSNLGGVSQLNTVLMLATVVAILGLGQGLVIMTGGIDLSLPWCITITAMTVSALSHGLNSGPAQAVVVALALGAFIGVVNGFGVVALKVSPVVMTLAVNIIIRGTVLVATNGTPPQSKVPPALLQLTQGRVADIPWLVIFLVVFSVIAFLIYSRTKFGRRVRAIGNSPHVATLSGLRVRGLVMGVYVVAGICGAIAGMVLAGQSGMSYLGMGDAFLLPSIAAVVLGGGSILGGRGHYIGTLGGAILLSTINVILLALSLSEAWRQIVFGVVILAAMWMTVERGARS